MIKSIRTYIFLKPLDILDFSCLNGNARSAISRILIIQVTKSYSIHLSASTIHLSLPHKPTAKPALLNYNKIFLPRKLPYTYPEPHTRISNTVWLVLYFYRSKHSLIKLAYFSTNYKRTEQKILSRQRRHILSDKMYLCCRLLFCCRATPRCQPLISSTSTNLSLSTAF